MKPESTERQAHGQFRSAALAYRCGHPAERETTPSDENSLVLDRGAREIRRGSGTDAVNWWRCSGVRMRVRSFGQDQVSANAEQALV